MLKLALELFPVFIILLGAGGVGGAAGPRDRCLQQPYLDVGCVAYHAQYNTPNLAFESPKWNVDGWKYYLIQDGKYLTQEFPKIVDSLYNLCQSEIDSSALAPLIEVLNETYTPAVYSKRYEVPLLETVPHAPLLMDYLEFYDSRQECFQMLSAMIPCLCVYPTLARRFQSVYDSKSYSLPQSVRHWISDNVADDACTLAQDILGDNINPMSHQMAMHFELLFFNLSRPQHEEL